MPPARAACPRSAAGQVVYLHAWPAVGQRARALELSSARTRQRRPTSETSPCRPAWSYRDPADAEIGRCRAREARTGTPQVFQAAPQAIDVPRHHYVELALGGVPAQCIERRSSIAALSAADAVISVDLRHLPVGPLCRLA